MHFQRRLGLDIAQCPVVESGVCGMTGTGGNSVGVLGVRVGAYGLREEILDSPQGSSC